jgi:hypothetical protein
MLVPYLYAITVLKNLGVVLPMSLTEMVCCIAIGNTVWRISKV